MPTRYLRPGIRDSERIDALSPLAEVLFYRLLVTVDDFGRTDARPAMVKAACFPVRESMTATKVSDLLAELHAKGLVVLYTVEDKPFLQLLRWDNAPRAKESKFPAPAGECVQVHASAQQQRTLLPETVTETETDNRTPPTPHGGGADRFTEFWQAWPKSERKQDKAKCAEHWKRNSLDASADQILADVRTKRGTRKWSEGFIEAPLVYLRGRRWLDGVTPDTGKPGDAVADWRDSRSGIEGKGEALGLGRWDEQAFQSGHGEHFQAYRARVERAADAAEQGTTDPQGQQQIAELIAGALKGRAAA